VQQFIAASEKLSLDGDLPRVGVIGLGRATIHFVTRRDCFSWARPDLRPHGDDAERLVSLVLQTMLGRAPDLMLDSTQGNFWTTIARYDLPSGARHFNAVYPGARSLPQEGPSAIIWRDLLRLAPSGVVDIDPAAVLSPVPAQRYEVLPGEAGIAQLLDQGVLEAIEWRNALKEGDRVQLGGIGDDKIGQPGYFRAPLGFRIVKPMRFPGGSVSIFSIAGPKFLVARGVPPPTGDPQAACVIDEETGKILMGEADGRCK
jgi:hypothetical protein